MIKLIAITPTSPFLVPDIGKDQISQLNKTLEALHNLSELIKAEKIDSVILVSHHNNLLNDVFTICYAKQFQTNFEKFGDYSLKDIYYPDHEIANAIRLNSQKKPKAIFVNQPNLEYSFGVPLYHLIAQETPIVPIGYSLLSFQDHFKFGEIIQQVAQDSPKNIAIIIATNVCGDPKDKNSEENKKIEKIILDSLKKNNIKNLDKLESQKLDETSSLSTKIFAITLGILSETDYTLDIMAKENPFNITYLTANINLKK